MIVLDTNVISEFMRPDPSPAVTAWLNAIPRGEIWTTSITVGELAAGIAMLPAGKRRTRLDEAFAVALQGFDTRILSFTPAAALRYGTVVAKRAETGCPISIADAQIAAVVHHAGATLATRNVTDFEATGVRVLDPWSAPPAS